MPPHQTPPTPHQMQPHPMPQTVAPQPDRWLLVTVISLVGTALVIAYAAWAYLQIWVLNPRAAMPEMSLPDIWLAVGQSQGLFDIRGTLIFLAIGPILAAALLIGGTIALRRRWWLVAGGHLLILLLGAPAYFLASFSPGMNLADTFGISGADYSPWAAPLFLVSLAALVGLILGAAWVGRPSPRSRAVSPTAPAVPS